MPLPDRVNAYLVCGGRYHDMDYARVELLKLLGEHARVRVRVGEDYSNTAAIEAADFLVTYTCDVIPPSEQQQALERFLGRRPRCGRRRHAVSVTHPGCGRRTAAASGARGRPRSAAPGRALQSGLGRVGRERGRGGRGGLGRRLADAV